MKYCEKCKKAYEDDQNFCSFCGSQTESLQEGDIVCTCGHVNTPDSKFCIRCGEALFEEELPPVETVSALKTFVPVIIAFALLVLVCVII